MSKDKIIFVGDVHGEFDTLGYDCKRFKHDNAYIIQVGDFGMGFCKPEYYRVELTLLNNILTDLNCHLYAIRGNHDDPECFRVTNNPFNLSNITLLKDYSELELLDKKILCVGGAISVDRINRIKRDKKRRRYNENSLPTWWDNERCVVIEPDKFKYNKYDVVVTHTRPGICGNFKAEYHIEELIKSDPPLRCELQEEAAELNKLWEYTKPELWVYGHFHCSDYFSNGVTTFRCLDIDEHKLYDK